MKKKNILLLLLLASLWGPSFLFIKIAVAEIPPITLVAIRLSLAAALLYTVMRLSKTRFPSGWGFWKKFIVMGFITNALPFVLFSFGEQFTDSGAASIINGTTPIFTVLLAHFLIGDERLNANRLLGVTIGFAGIALIFFPDVQSLLREGVSRGGRESLGLLAFLVASMCYGVALVYGRLKLRGLPPLVGPAAQLICAAAITLPIALIVDRPFDLAPGAPALLSAVVLGVFGTAFAYLIYYRLVDSAGAGFISLVTYLLPPIGLVLGMLFLSETPAWYSFAGLFLILAGVMIVNRVRADQGSDDARLRPAAD